jgi:hypothetical protein
LKSKEETKYLDPAGLPDWTLPVSVVAQAIETLKVDIVAQSIGNLNVNIASSSITLNVKTAPGERVDVGIVESITLNINIAGQSATLNVHEAGTANVAITSSITLDMNIVGATVNVPVVNPAGQNLNVAIQSSTTLNINITGASVNVPVTNPAGQNLNVAIQSSITLNVNISSQSAVLNVNISSQSANLNVNIQAQAVNVKVIAPSGGAVSVGGPMVISSVVNNVSVSAGSEVSLLSISGRCRLMGLGIRSAGATSTTRTDYTYIRIYVDGALKVDIMMDSLDRLNGYHMLERAAATSTKYYADAVNPKGALTATLTCSDVSTSYQRCGGFLNVETEASSSIAIKAYQPSGYGNVTVNIVAFYGVYL